MKRCYINEDRTLTKLPVRLSEKLQIKIENVFNNNQDNIEYLRQWYENIESVKNQLSPL